MNEWVLNFICGAGFAVFVGLLLMLLPHGRPKPPKRFGMVLVRLARWIEHNYCRDCGRCFVTCPDCARYWGCPLDVADHREREHPKGVRA